MQKSWHVPAMGQGGKLAGSETGKTIVYSWPQ